MLSCLMLPVMGSKNWIVRPTTLNLCLLKRMVILTARRALMRMTDGEIVFPSADNLEEEVEVEQAMLDELWNDAD
jgi:hypothetical protein